MRILLLMSVVVCVSTFHEANAGLSCEYEGKIYHQGEKFNKDCNKCRCNKNDEITCTMRTCGEMCEWKDCSKVPCPLLSCVHGSHTPANKCCPVCNPAPRTMAMGVASVCSPVTCRMYCDFGFVKNDTTGCDICKCNKSPCDVDPNPCPEDSDKPVCDVRQGKAVCIRQHCPPICAMYCQFGFKINETTDCPICSCREHPCAEPNPCPDDKPFCLVKDRKAVCQKCSPVMCMMFCTYGFKMNDNGCPICSCKESPCKEKTCPTGNVCEVQKSECDKEPCPLVATCIVDPALPCTDPEKDGTGNVVFCNISNDCSDDYKCDKSAGEDFATCCPLKQCEHGDKTYNDGDGVPATDGCNKCVCANGLVACTRMMCVGCKHNGKTYKNGESFNRGDGCNTCSCSNGIVSCTRMYCAHCLKDGIMYPVGENVKGDGICDICTCINDPFEPSGTRVACAVIDCPPLDMLGCDDPITDPDECCPYCPL
ncbi:unnamed protein product [Owenia fusiformis]|uniref:Uncharacterized protein n=1 Tax=Owenia fusiformis TaxID=6347 RepID=A0A8J1U923_OWEFU|nr:unnamed protein product [Owenia fusiformis]